MKTIKFPTYIAAQNAYLTFGLIALLRPPFEVLVLKRERIFEVVISTFVFANVLSTALYILDKRVTR